MQGLLLIRSVFLSTLISLFNFKSTMSKKRPGVEAAVRLAAKSSDPTLWSHVDKHYDEVISKIGNLTTFQANADKLGNELKSGSKNFITKSELLDVIIPWKFAVGKPRHALMKQLASNTESAVTAATKLGISHARDISSDDDQKEKKIQAAVEAIADLKGVGPATASVVLSLVRPDLFGYMYDEVIDCFLPKRTYTLKVYLTMNEECAKSAICLGGDWTTAKVAKTLWLAARAQANNWLDVLAVTKETASKRRGEENEKATPSNSASKRRRRK